MKNSTKKVAALGLIVGLAVLIGPNCAPAPEVRKEPEPEVEIGIPAEPAFLMMPYHISMLEEMQKSFERADEVILGVYTGNYTDDQLGRSFYFENFKRFNRETLAWGLVENILLPINFREVHPEIISRAEFKTLSELDKVGICWDYYEQTRYVYLVEGEQTLVFLVRQIDEASSTSYRNLIDTYPATSDCQAKAVFDLMVRRTAVLE